MADESKAAADATVVLTGADEATLVQQSKPAMEPAAMPPPAAATVAGVPPAAQTGSASWTALAGAPQRAPAAPSRPIWLGIALGVGVGLALFAATALLLLRG